MNRERASRVSFLFGCVGKLPPCWRRLALRDFSMRRFRGREPDDSREQVVVCILLEHDLNARAGLDLARVKTTAAVIASGGFDPQPRLFVPAHANELLGSILPDQEHHLSGMGPGH